MREGGDSDTSHGLLAYAGWNGVCAGRTSHRLMCPRRGPGACARHPQRTKGRKVHRCLRSETEAGFTDPGMEIANLVLIPAEQDSQHTACVGEKVRVEIDGSPWKE